MKREPRDTTHLSAIRTRSPRVDLAGFPDFLILGPQRTGTTWLYHNLRRHPRIFLPEVKETYYFSTLGKPEHGHYRFAFLEDYLGLFRESFRRRLKRHYDALRRAGTWFRPDVYGEATATYAMLPGAVISEILTLKPELRAILMVRDPVERAWSHAKKDLLRAGVAMGSAGDCLGFMESAGQLRCADYASMSSTWGQYLKAGHLYCGDYRRLTTDPGGLLREICAFVGVDPGLLPDGGPESERINPTDDVSMPAGLHERLAARFAEESRSAQDLLRRGEGSKVVAPEWRAASFTPAPLPDAAYTKDQKLRTGCSWKILVRGMAIAALAVVLAGCAGSMEGYGSGAGSFDTVIVDAGHGGHDTGARSVSGSREKVLALDTSRRLADALRRRGFRVIETRTSDCFIPLSQRSAVANLTPGSIFVSIHYNWSRRTGARGLEVYYFSAKSRRLAANILKETLRAYPTENRGVKSARFHVLRTNRRPAVLCELGFLSNPGDNRYAQSWYYRQKIADRIAAGIAAEREGRRP